MASVASKTWTDEEVGLLLDVFAEETIQIGLEKAKCPKDKNTVYLEMQTKLEQHGKFYMLKSFLLTVFISSLSFRSDAVFLVVSQRNNENCGGNYWQIEEITCKIQNFEG